jgi:hypothetical protein
MEPSMPQLFPIPLSVRRRQLIPGTALLFLVLLAFGPSLGAHPLMDDHLFFAWLEQTPWPEAIWQRLTGNWIPYFNQMQMYRPVSGIVQVLTYQLFGIWSLPHHLLNLVLHCLTSLLAGILTFRLTQNPGAGWCAAASQKRIGSFPHLQLLRSAGRLPDVDCAAQSVVLDIPEF